MRGYLASQSRSYYDTPLDGTFLLGTAARKILFYLVQEGETLSRERVFHGGFCFEPTQLNATRMTVRTAKQGRKGGNIKVTLYVFFDGWSALKRWKGVIEDDGQEEIDEQKVDFLIIRHARNRPYRLGIVDSATQTYTPGRVARIERIHPHRFRVFFRRPDCRGCHGQRRGSGISTSDNLASTCCRLTLSNIDPKHVQQSASIFHQPPAGKRDEHRVEGATASEQSGCQRSSSALRSYCVREPEHNI